MSDIRQKVSTALAGVGVSVQFMIRPTALPAISFDFGPERGAVYGDGQERESEFSVQVDIWTQSDFKTLAATVHAAMKAAGFRRYDSQELLDETTSTYQKAMRYRITLPA